MGTWLACPICSCIPGRPETVPSCRVATAKNRGGPAKKSQAKIELQGDVFSREAGKGHEAAFLPPDLTSFLLERRVKSSGADWTLLERHSTSVKIDTESSFSLTDTA